MVALTPVDNDPFATKLIPVDNDPFATKPPVPSGYQSPSWLPGAGYLHKLSNIFDDSATLGTADPATATVGNLLRSAGVSNVTPDTATLRAQTAQNRADVGPLASGAADIAGYAVGPGTIGVGENLARLAGGKLLARMGGSVAENALAAGGGTLGHGGSLSDAGKAATVGSLIGAVTGALPGGSGPRSSTPTTADLKVVKENAFAPLNTTTVNAPTVDAAVNGVSRSSGANFNLSDTFKGKVADLEKEVTGTQAGLTAGDVANYQRGLWGKVRNEFDKRAAGQYENALNTAVGPSLAYDIKAANAAHNVYKTSGEIDNWLTNPAKAPNAIAGRLAKKPDFYKSQPGLFDLLQSISQSQPGLLSKMTGKVGAGLAGAAIQGGAEYLGGQNPIVGALAGGLEGLVLGHGINQFRVAPIKANLLAAKHLNATGVELPPRKPISGPLGDLARTVGYAAGSSGAF